MSCMKRVRDRPLVLKIFLLELNLDRGGGNCRNWIRLIVPPWLGRSHVDSPVSLMSEEPGPVVLDKCDDSV